jgi:uncharacterized delta-60 repeat protein
VVCHIPSIIIQPNGKMFVAGLASIFRLHPDGMQDTNFLVSVRKVAWGGMGHWIYYPANVASLILQPDGRIVAVGDFNRVNYLPCNGVARLNLDSTVDGQFTANAPAIDGVPRTAALQPDGKLLVGGSSLVRLNPDGTRDTSFTFTSDGTIHAIATLPNEKILVGGSFTFINNHSRQGLGRLRADGSLDMNFNPAIIVEESILTSAAALAVTKDTNILVAGEFSDGTARVVQLDASGSLMAGFNSGLRFSGGVNTIIEQSDGAVLVAGAFTSVSGIPRPGIARLTGERSHIRLPPPALGPDGSLRILTGSHVGETYVLQKSFDLNAWLTVETNTAVDCTLELIDPAPSRQRGFYRVLKID